MPETQCPATGWQPDPALGARDWRPPNCTCSETVYYPFHHAVMIHGEIYVRPDEAFSGKLSDEEMMSLARQVLLRQRTTDA